MRRIRIPIGNTDTVTLKWRHDFTPDRPLPRYPEFVANQQSPHHILNALNDDCLRVIFVKLAEKDLCAAYNIAYVCQRFRHVLAEIRPKQIEVTNENCKPLRNVEKMICIFGASFQTAHIRTRCCPDIILVFLSRYCPNLVELKGSFDSNNTMVEIGAFISRLRRLQIHNVGQYTNTLFVPSAHIESIHTGSVSSLPAIHYPKLRSLKAEIRGVAVSKVQRFFALNKQIEELGFFALPRYYIPTILANVPNLQKLDTIFVHLHEEDITAICQLKHLHTLRMEVYEGDVVSMLIALLVSGIQLKHLKFFTGADPINFDIMYLTQMKSLEHLEISGLRDSDLLRLIDNCTNLKEIHARSNYLTPQGVHNALRHATHLESLTWRNGTWRNGTWRF